MTSQKAYFPYLAFKNRPYIAEFMALPDKDRRWEILTQLALSRTRAQFGEENRTHPRTSTCCMAEAKLCDHLAGFFGGGQAVFHIAKSLRDAFLTSDLGDAQVSDLKFPFDSLYVHLGADLGFTFNDGAAALEGAFLQHRSTGELNVSLVGSLVAAPEHWGERGMESFSFFFDKDDSGRPLLEAITARLARMAQDPNTVEAFSDWTGYSEEEKKRVQDGWASHAEERVLHAKNAAVVLDCVKLVANALLYLAQYPEDMEEGWQDGAPVGFTEKYARSDGKTRERTLSKARSAGFTLIRRVGRLFEQDQPSEPGASPLPHLRRAHWRRQAHGPGSSLRKLCWIRAVRVLGGTHRERPYLVAERPEMAVLP